MAACRYQVLCDEANKPEVIHSERPTLNHALSTAYRLAIEIDPEPDVTVIADERVIIYPRLQQDPPNWPPVCRWGACLKRPDPRDPTRLDTSGCSDSAFWTPMSSPRSVRQNEEPRQGATARGAAKGS
jgi:hypothetical protein